METRNSHIEQVQSAKKLLLAKQAFCLFKLPNSAQAELAYAHGTTPPTEGAALVVEDWNRSNTIYFSAALPSTASEAVKPTSAPSNTPFEAYANQFAEYQKTFATGKIQKAILSRIKVVDRPVEFDSFEAFAQLCDQRPDTFNYLLNHPNMGLWMGASPEVLLKTREQRAETVSLAGTQIIRADGNYLWTAKEKEEQELVSQHIRNVLDTCSNGPVVEKGPETTSAGNVVHLKTQFEFELSPKAAPLEIVGKLHPTPAIAGLPVSAAQELIEKTETHQRLLYTGFIGKIHKNRSDLFVNLRCMQIHPETISLYVGGGLTAQSDLEAEWNETEEKAKTLERILYA